MVSATVTELRRPDYRDGIRSRAQKELENILEDLPFLDLTYSRGAHTSTILPDFPIHGKGMIYVSSGLIAFDLFEDHVDTALFIAELDDLADEYFGIETGYHECPETDCDLKDIYVIRFDVDDLDTNPFQVNNTQVGLSPKRDYYADEHEASIRLITFVDFCAKLNSVAQQYAGLMVNHES